MSEKININDLVDIRTVNVDENLSKEERILEYVRQIKNPYHFRCGKYIVHAEFTKDGPTLEELLLKMAIEKEAERIINKCSQ